MSSAFLSFPKISITTKVAVKSHGGRGGRNSLRLWYHVLGCRADTLDVERCKTLSIKPLYTCPVGHRCFLPLRPRPTSHTDQYHIWIRSDGSHICTRHQWCHHHALPAFTCRHTCENKSVHERPSTASTHQQRRHFSSTRLHGTITVTTPILSQPILYPYPYQSLLWHIYY